MYRRRQYVRAVGIAATVPSIALAGCFHETGEKTQFAEMRDQEFDPKNARAEEEQPFGWENHDDVAHVVTSASDNWEFETEVSPGNLTSHTFDDSGVFQVVCSEHGDPDEFTGMRMKIAVGDASIEDPVE